MFSVNNLTRNPAVAITSHFNHRRGNITTRKTGASKTSNNGIPPDRTKDVTERTQVIITVKQTTVIRPRAIRIETYPEPILCPHKIRSFFHRKKAFLQFFLLTNTNHSELANVLLHNGSQVKLTVPSELLHLTTY